MARLLIYGTLTAFCWIAFAKTDLDARFEKINIKVGNKTASVYVADDEEKREKGLMHVERLPLDTGMLFVFDSERPLNFWMKNTLIPLAIGFFDHTGKLIDKQEMKIADSQLSNDVPTYRSLGDAQFALEMPAGWFAQHKIENGARLQITSSTKSELLRQTAIVGKRPSGQ